MDARTPARYTLSWTVFAVALVNTGMFIARTLSDLPTVVASHFDAAGNPTAYMSHGGYARFIFLLGVGLPIAAVAMLSRVYRRAPDMRLPNASYWLSAEHIEHTRAMLTAHAAWFGALLCGVVSFVHWLVLRAHRSDPPHLANELALGGIVLFVAASGIWVAAAMFMFRLPAVVDSRGFREGVRSGKEKKAGRHPS